MKVIRPVLEHSAGGYVAKLNIGTFPQQKPSYMTYYFHFDTDSDVIWLQCEECNKPEGHCFHQTGPLYPNRMSTTYVPLLYGKDRLCFQDQHWGHYCSYNVHYSDDDYSNGILAYEKITFEQTHTYKPAVAHVVIGFGIQNKLHINMNGKEAGVLGMNWGAHSFVNHTAKVDSLIACPLSVLMNMVDLPLFFGLVVIFQHFMVYTASPCKSIEETTLTMSY